MVAVTTTTHCSRPTLRTPGSHLALVPRPAGAVVAEGEPARCGCHRQDARDARVVALRRRAGSRHLPPPAVPEPGRVYRRRRLVAALVVAGLAFVAWAALGALGGALTASGRSVPAFGRPASVQVVEVAPGDTFWTIAQRLQPEGDPRPLVDRLVRAHGGTVLQVGEEIALPSST